MTSSAVFGSALLIILAIDLFLMFGQVAVDEVSTEGTQFYNNTGDLLGTEYNEGYALTEITDINSFMPTTRDSVTSDTEGNIFTELFSSVKNWFLDTTGLRYVVMFINAVPNFLKSIGLPLIMVYGIGALWHIISIFLTVAFVWGR